MPTQTELNEQLQATVTKLTAANKTLEEKYLAVCRENDQLKGNALIDKNRITELESDLAVILGRLDHKNDLLQGLAQEGGMKG